MYPLQLSGKSLHGLTTLILLLLLFSLTTPPLLVKPTSGNSDWWNTEWNYRKKITFNNTAINENLLDFPMPIIFNSSQSDFWSHVKGDGSDIRFIDSDNTTQLYYELEQFNSTSMDMVAWVKIPQIDKESTTDHIWVYYGNSEASFGSYYDSSQVWTNDYVAVWHFNKTGKDATLNNHDGTITGTIDNIRGKIGGAYNLLGSSDYIRVSDSPDLWLDGTDFTISMWVNHDTLDTSWLDSLIGKGQSGQGYGWQLALTGVSDTNPDGRLRFGDGGWSQRIGGYSVEATDLGQWNHIAVTYNSSSHGFPFWKDGTDAGNGTGADPYSSNSVLSSSGLDLYIGIDPRDQDGYDFDGILDEIRISNAYRSAEWIEACYQYQVDRLKFQYRSEETTQPTKLSVDPPLVEMTVTDINDTFRVNVTVERIWDLQGFDINLTWNNDLLTLVDVEFNSTLNNIWGRGNWFPAVNQTGLGYYKLAAVSTSVSFSSTTPFPLVILTFRVEGPICNSIRETAIHFKTHKMSDSGAESIPHTAEDGTYRVTGEQPTLQIGPVETTCRKYCENFTITVNVSDACNVEGFKFEIHYNTTLLDYVAIEWNAWLSGNITVQEMNGNIAGSTAGEAKTGNFDLISIEFHAACYHIWKECSEHVNNLTGKTYIQWANLSYPDAPDLRYEKDTLFEIHVTPVEVTYIFAPIQGDVDNDGDVDIFDLRTVAYYYNVDDGDPEWVGASKFDLNCDRVINNSDLMIISENFWFKYSRWKPSAYFYYTPGTPYVDETVHFNASQSSSHSSTIENYAWNFGDDSHGHGVVVNHTFADSGEYDVILTVTDNKGITDDFHKSINVLSLPAGVYLDVYTQRNGKGLSESSDAFAPDERVEMIGYLINNEVPIVNKTVDFRLYSPDGTIISNVADETDEDGLAHHSYLIPTGSTFGIYTIEASTSVEGDPVTDTVWFRVGWLIEVLDSVPCDSQGIPKSEFEIGEQLYLSVRLQNICFQSKDTLLATTIYDVFNQPLLYDEEEYRITSGETTVLLNSGVIPHWAYIGNATAHLVVLDLTGMPYCPMASTWFMIRPPS